MVGGAIVWGTGTVATAPLILVAEHLPFQQMLQLRRAIRRRQQAEALPIAAEPARTRLARSPGD